jgi:hypothetical protein
MEQSQFWEANNRSASQAYILWNLEVLNMFTSAPTLVHILSHIKPAHTLKTNFF